MLDLYTIEGSCSTAVRDLLNYLSITYTDKPRSEFRLELEVLNPAASVPTLNTDFGALTESGAILLHIAESAGAVHLLGETAAERARVLEILFFLNSTFYYAFIPWFRPEKYAQSTAAQGEVKAAALEQIETAAKRLRWLAGSSTSYLVGDKLSVADFIGLVYLNWLARVSPEVMQHSGLASIHASLSRLSKAG